MTKQEWLEKVRSKASVLRAFVGNWHPSARQPRAIQRESVLLADGGTVAVDVVPEAHMPITAPLAERACQNVRESIRRKEPQDPLERWDKAILDGNVGEIASLLDGAWFGVPESTSCWQIPGFGDACDLMDDPPENPDEEPKHPTGCICADCSSAILDADND